MLKIFCSPSRYVQGREATRQLAPELVRIGIGERALFIVGPTARAQTEPMSSGIETARHPCEAGPAGSALSPDAGDVLSGM